MLDSKEGVSWLAENENEGMLHYLQSRTGDKRLRCIVKEEELYVGSIFYFTVIGEKNKLEELKSYFDDKSQFVCTLQQELYRDGVVIYERL